MLLVLQTCTPAPCCLAVDNSLAVFDFCPWTSSKLQLCLIVVLLQALEGAQHLAESCEGVKDQRQRRAPTEKPVWAEPRAAAGSADCAVRATARHAHSSGFGCAAVPAMHGIEAAAAAAAGMLTVVRCCGGGSMLWQPL